jgi:hypothetical protein
MLHGFAKRLVFLVVSGISLLLLGLMMPITSYAHSAQDGDGYYSHHPKIEIAKKAFLVVIKQKHDDEKAADTQDRVEKRFTKAIVVALFFKCFPKKEDLDSHKKGFIVVFVKQIVKFKGYVKVIWGKTVILNHSRSLRMRRSIAEKPSSKRSWLILRERKPSIRNWSGSSSSSLFMMQ